MSIGVLEYGLGNVDAFGEIFKRHDIPAIRVSQPAQLADVSRLILPGVGAFDFAMERFQSSGLREAVDDLVMDREMPVLGICVGMQMMAERSEEGALEGLGWVSATVRDIGPMLNDPALPRPHMGWNQIAPKGDVALFDGIGTDARFYFLHSYYFDCAQAANTIATARYGGDFCCAIQRKNVYGTQFHPEKSHHWGTRVLLNFATTPCSSPG